MTTGRTESTAMRLCRRLGLERMAWSLRRLHCPVDKDALVLEVGSGGNPYARANVLLDAYEDTQERHWVPLKVDRPFVFGFIERLPFKDRAFDFLIASHVLEHSPHPERALSEFQRVSKAGYIEVPDAFMERVNPYQDHRLEITVRNNRLMIRKKAAAIVDSALLELYKDRAKPLFVRELLQRHPFSFHVRYYWWTGDLDFVVVNPDVDASWASAVPGDDEARLNPGLRGRIRASVREWLRAPLSQRGRNRTLDLMPLLACPSCGSDQLASSPEHLTCTACRATYRVRDGIPVMIVAGSASGVPA